MKVLKNKKKIKVKTKSKPKLTRRELRKQKVEEKKEHKRIFFSNKTQGKELVEAAKQQQQQKQQQERQKKIKKTKKKVKKVAAPSEDTPIEQLMQVSANDDESIDSDFSDAEVDAIMPAKKPSAVIKKGKMAQRPDLELAHQRELKRQKELSKAASKQRIKQLKVENEEEDKIIQRLEKKLKLNRAKDKNRLVRKMFSSDGLDWALEFCLDDDEQKSTKKNQNKMPIDDDDDDDEMDFSEDDEANSELSDAKDIDDTESEAENTEPEGKQ